MHFSSGGLSPSGAREAVDPIAELLSQLSGVRRAAAVPYDRLLHRHTSSSSSQQQQSSSSGGAQGGGSSGGGTQRRSVFPQPSGGQTVILSETAATMQPPNHIGLESSGNQKHDKHQFLLDK